MNEWVNKHGFEIPIPNQKHSGGQAVESPASRSGSVEAKVDGYWLRMATIAVDALDAEWRPDLTPDGREGIIEYLARVLDGTYKSGINLGVLKARMDILKKPALRHAQRT